MIHLLIDLSYMTGKTSHAGTEFVRYFGSLKRQNTWHTVLVYASAGPFRALSIGYLEDAKFYLESKASVIDISGIASFKLFLIACLREYCTFSDSSVVSLKSSPWLKSTQLGTIFQKKSCSTIKLFFFFKYVLYLTVLSKYLEKESGVTVLV